MLFSILIMLLFYQFIRDKKSKPNHLEQILSLLRDSEKHFTPEETVYLISTPSSDELLFKTQFALAPVRVVKAHKNLPINASLLIINDLKAGNEMIQTEAFAKGTDTIFNVRDSIFSIILLKTK